MAPSQASEKSLEVCRVGSDHFGMPGETCESVVSDKWLSGPFLLAEYSPSTELLVALPALLPVVCATLYPSTLAFSSVRSCAGQGRVVSRASSEG